MKKYAKAVFWTLLIGLIVFVLAFATPLVSSFTSGAVLSSLGCQTAGFDTRATCPPGSFGHRFIPLNGIIASIIAPMTFVKQLGDIALIWGLATLAAAFFAAEYKPKR
jgi:hypothetical protein